MSPVEIIALIFIGLVVIKLVIVLPSPQTWKSVVKKIYSKPAVTMTAGLAAAGIILSYLLDELTIVQIFAAMTFMMALMMIQFAAFGKELEGLMDKFYDDRSLIRKAWFSIVLWISLIAWVLFDIFVN